MNIMVESFDLQVPPAPTNAVRAESIFFNYPLSVTMMLHIFIHKTGNWAMKFQTYCGQCGKTVTVETDLNEVELYITLGTDQEIEVRHTTTVPRRTDHIWYLSSEEKDDLLQQIDDGLL